MYEQHVHKLVHMDTCKCILNCLMVFDIMYILLLKKKDLSDRYNVNTSNPSANKTLACSNGNIPPLYF